MAGEHRYDSGVAIMPTFGMGNEDSAKSQKDGGICARMIRTISSPKFAQASFSPLKYETV
ncbi:hypothetical protein VP1G_11049 [Cytospora mali]|uniref:Uncharacterized protein n=1 Tax=Cytospora mali TaxID=578113 RepID=A0A194V5G1_CYTMA|nr:hypothetical protein VP1G_11049 [Valsa mali var. pyri (nom. inval.)]